MQHVTSSSHRSKMSEYTRVPQRQTSIAQSVATSSRERSEQSEFNISLCLALLSFGQPEDSPDESTLRKHIVPSINTAQKAEIQEMV